MWDTKYTVYRGIEYSVLRYRDGRVKLIDNNHNGLLTDESGSPVSFCFVSRDKIGDIYYKHTYGIVDGYSVRVLSDEDLFNYYIGTKSKSAARALSLKDRDKELFCGFVEKSRVKTRQVKVKI